MSDIVLTSVQEHQADKLYTLAIGTMSRAHKLVAKIFDLRIRETQLMCTLYGLTTNKNWAYITEIRERSGMDLVFRGLCDKMLASLLEKNMIEKRLEHNKTLYRLTTKGVNALTLYNEEIAKLLP